MGDESVLPVQSWTDALDGGFRQKSHVRWNDARGDDGDGRSYDHDHDVHGFDFGGDDHDFGYDFGLAFDDCRLDFYDFDLHSGSEISRDDRVA